MLDWDEVDPEWQDDASRPLLSGKMAGWNIGCRSCFMGTVRSIWSYKIIMAAARSQRQEVYKE